MADGRDEVGAARDWLRDHGVVVPESGAGPGGPEPVGAGAEGGSGRLGARSGPGGDGRSETEAGADGERRSETAAGRRRSARSAGGRGRGGRRTAGSGSWDADRDDGDDAADHGARSGGSGPDRGGRGRSDDLDADPEQVARTIVLRKLTAQSRTRAELERALRSKEVPEEAAAAVLDRMGEVGLVDDAAFARDWVASRQQRRHLSRTALRRELQTKGVDRDVIDEALADVGGADEHRAALDLARRRAAPMAGLPREVAYRRLGGVLARRGFSASVTARVLSEVLEARDED